jgi:AcrR family transcriptional regulator
MAGGRVEPEIEAPATRQRILAAAAILFGGRGFHGTSTRAIAERVGISQPSLFHHFPSKASILTELVARDLAPALARIIAYRSCADGAAPRLWAYLYDDTASLVDSPFDARGLYNDEVLAQEELVALRDMREELHRHTRDLLAEGVASGEFRPVSTDFAQQVITGMLLDTIWVAGSGLSSDLERRPQEIADFVLLGLLQRPTSLPQVREEARRVRECVAAAAAKP